jgi:outer membrane protein assembly factor BamB
MQQGYGSLNLVKLTGKKQLLNLAGTSLNGIDPDTGKILWTFPWKTSMAISVGQPLAVHGNQIFISTGYGKGAALIKVLKKKGNAYSSMLIWSNIHMKNKFTSSVIYKGTVFGLNEGVLTALDLATGKRLWRGKKYGHGQVLLADGHLIVTGEQGLLAWVEATPTAFKEVSSTQAFTSRTWNTPAIAGGLLLLRNDREMVCYDLKAP